MFTQSVNPNLILSLTSHPPRFPFLLKQLNRVTRQTLFPDLLVLNITKEDYSEIPKELAILDLPFAFEINLVENLGPGKKLIPTLIKYPSSTIITIDDDIDYPESLIESLWRESKEYPGAIIAGRAHQPLFFGRKLAPYLSWDFEITETANYLIFPTGVGGTLYPPNSLHAEVLNTEVYKDMSWSTDDIWFWVHSLRAGTEIRKSQFLYELKTVGLGKSSALSEKGNREIMNDLILNTLWNFYNLEMVLDNYIREYSISIKNISQDLLQNSDSLFVYHFLQNEKLNQLIAELPMKYRLIYAESIVYLCRNIKIMERQKSEIRRNILSINENLYRKLKHKNIKR